MPKGLDMLRGISKMEFPCPNCRRGAERTHSIWKKMRELSVQSANDRPTNSDRDQIAIEFEELKKKDL